MSTTKSGHMIKKITYKLHSQNLIASLESMNSANNSQFLFLPQTK